MGLIFHFKCTLKCRLQFVSIWTSLKFCRLVMGLTLSQTSSGFYVSTHKPFKNTVRKGEIACNKQFFLFSQCFLPYMGLIFHFKCTLKCFLQFVSIWTSLKFCRLVMGLTLSQTSSGFYLSAHKPIENTSGKGEIARIEQFLLFPQCFLPVWKTFSHFHPI